MTTIFFWTLVVFVGLIIAMVVSTRFRDFVMTKWGAFGAFLAGIAAAVLNWWGGTSVPPM